MPIRIARRHKAQWIARLLCLACLLASVVAMAYDGGPMDGFADFRAERYGEALLAFRRQVARNPDSASAAANVGAALARLGRHEEAVAALGEASRLTNDPRVQSAIFFDMANEQTALGRYAEAIDSYKAALRLNPGDMQAKANLEIALRRQPKTPPPEPSGDESKDGPAGDGASGGGGAPQSGAPKQGPPPRFTRDEAERLLDAIGRRERLEFPKRAKATPADPSKPDW